MDKRTLTALVLSMLVLVGWQMLFMKPQVQPGVQEQVAQHSDQVGAQAPKASEPAKMEAATRSGIPRQEEALRTSYGDILFSNDSRAIDNWSLRKYTKPDHSAPVDLNSTTLQEGSLQLAFDSKDLSYVADVRGELRRERNVLIWNYSDDKIAIERRITADESAPFLDVQTRVDFKSAKAQHAFLIIRAKATGDSATDVDRMLVYWSDEALGEINLGDTIELAYPPAPVSWVGAMNRYFTFAVIPMTQTKPKAVIQPLADHAARISMTFPVEGSSITLPYRVYFGPKDLNLLKMVDPTLTKTVNFGWLTFFATPLLQLMKWFYGFVHNYGLAIILLTLVVRLLTFPLTYKSMKNMRHMAKLQPQLKKIQEKHKDDKEALNREMMVMMRTQGYNPVAGCLPILVQLPVFFALYRVLYGAVELYQAPFFAWIHDLSEKDPFYITPVLLTGTMFLQQKLTPSTITDPVQARVMQFMPILFGVMMVNLPSGLTLYMLVSTLAGIVQQVILNRKLDVHATPEPARAR